MSQKCNYTSVADLTGYSPEQLALMYVGQIHFTGFGNITIPTDHALDGPDELIEDDISSALSSAGVTSDNVNFNFVDGMATLTIFGIDDFFTDYGIPDIVRYMDEPLENAFENVGFTTSDCEEIQHNEVEHCSYEFFKDLTGIDLDQSTFHSVTTEDGEIIFDEGLEGMVNNVAYTEQGTELANLLTSNGITYAQLYLYVDNGQLRVAVTQTTTQFLSANFITNLGVSNNNFTESGCQLINPPDLGECNYLIAWPIVGDLDSITVKSIFVDGVDVMAGGSYTGTADDLAQLRSELTVRLGLAGVTTFDIYYNIYDDFLYLFVLHTNNVFQSGVVSYDGVDGQPENFEETCLGDGSEAEPGWSEGASNASEGAWLSLKRFISYCCR